MITKLCRDCKALIPYPLTRCEECKAKHTVNKKDNDYKYNKIKRNKKHDKFYHSADWKKLSKATLIKHGYRCARCKGIATEVDHVNEIDTDFGWEKRLDPMNLQPLCTRCHNSKRRGQRF